MSFQFENADFDRLRQLDSDETRALVHDAIKKVFDKQKPYVHTLCNTKDKLSDFIERAVPEDAEAADHYLPMLAAAHNFASNESLYHHTFDMANIVLLDAGEKLSILSLHALFSMCLEQNMQCYESLLLLQKVIMQIEQSGSMHFDDEVIGRQTYQELLVSMRDLVGVSETHAVASEDYIKTMEFVIDDNRTIN